MKKLMVYSHDTFGLGNIRRMLSICTNLLDSIPDLLILLVSGSPMIHSFRIPNRLDYIKLPCLRRDEAEGYSARSLDSDINDIDIMRLRSDLILTAAANFKPDLLMVNKKPSGVKNELKGTLDYLKMNLPDTKNILVLRDVLDSPAERINVWGKNGYFDAILSFYDHVLDDGCRSSSFLQPDHDSHSKITDSVLALLSSSERKLEGVAKERSICPVPFLNPMSNFTKVATHSIHQPV